MANRLIHEQSPYLLQHAHNPVDWHPWGDEPFERAKAEHKPVIVSIGYAACHWCHVMERESFENEEVAAYMNGHFICIKVDREEHPDVDHLYMDAVQAITGAGGWPLNVFVTPDRIPFYGGTYYPPQPAYGRPSWLQLLQRMAGIWAEQQDEVAAQADQMVQYLRQASGVAMKADAVPATAEDCRKMADELLKKADKKWGGFGQAPKFPGTMVLSFLLERYHFSGQEAGRTHALRSLDAMIEGGIYDQLGGGFARYSTDREWLAPHFEKMLYDNALLLLTLCDAYQLTQQPRYKEVIQETIAFVERELTHPSGGCHSALDADSEGVEGKFYTWTWESWTEALGGPDELAAAYFGVVEAGNWEHTNILHRAKSPDALGAAFGKGAAEVMEHIGAVKKRLFAIRQGRVRPHTDDKCLLSWNALMSLAYTRAGVALEEAIYLERAAGHMRWMLDAFALPEGLMHTWKDGKARIPAKLDDYAFLIQALLQLGIATADHGLIYRAAEETEIVLQHFSDEGGCFFYFTAERQLDIPVRKIDVYDGATPSANAVMAHNLLTLGMLLERPEWLRRGEDMLGQMTGTVLRYTYSFGYWALLLQRQAIGLKTVVTTGPDAAARVAALRKCYAPEAVVLGAAMEKKVLPIQKIEEGGSETLIFVCTTMACLPPVTSVEAVTALLRGSYTGKKNEDDPFAAGADS